MAAPDRSAADRDADKRRDPVPFLSFAGLKPGMKVLDMGAGAGYSTELDARVVGPSGVVYGQNPPGFPERAVAALQGARGQAHRNIIAALAVRSTIRCRPTSMISTPSRFCSSTMTTYMERRPRQDGQEPVRGA